MDSTASSKKSSADSVFEALKSKIENHYWYPGDRLPAENDLAEEYEVSRVTIRTALHKLSALGYVETRTGGGTYVSKFDFFQLISSVSGLMFNNISHGDISVFRTALETASIDLLMGRPVLSRYVREMQGCINRMKKAAEIRDIISFSNADYDFHLALCKMTENGMFVYAYEMLFPMLLRYFQEHYIITTHQPAYSADEGRRHYDDAILNHQAILDAIVAGDCATAKQIVSHMANSSTPLSYREITEKC